MKKAFIAALSASLLLVTCTLSALDDNRNFYVRNRAALAKTAAEADLTRNLEYDFSRASVRMTYYTNLDKLAKFLIANKAPLALRGYADSIGAYKANWVLSDKRAMNVKKYLVEKGVSDQLIVTTPFGSTKPIASNKTPQGRQRNRRVEVKISQI